MPDWVLARRRVIGDRLREVRRRADLSQVQLGERVGLDHKTIHRYETAQRAPSLNELLLIADALRVPLSDLVR
jgi:transcriptional regulator with XRE-family HTH domain